MSLRLVTGRSGSGKTRFILDEIRAKLAEDPQGSPLVLLVPEQATFQAEYAMANTPGLGGFMRAQVLSFRRLAFRIMQETGGSAVVPIHENGKAMLLHKVLEDRREELKLFRGGSNETGLIARMGELFTELKRYGVDGAGLSHAARDARSESSLLKDKLHDLSLLYAETERELDGKWLDGEDMLGRLSDGALASAWLAEAEIWVDGFHGFTPNEYSVIRSLLRRSKRVTVALCADRPYLAGDRPDEMNAFHPTAETSAKLCELAAESGVATDASVHLNPVIFPRFARSRMLAFLEKEWTTRVRWTEETAVLHPDHPDCGISLHAAAGRRAEADAAARDMLRRVREEGFRYRDMAVFVRQMEDYADLLAGVFDSYGIPYYLDGKAGISHHPLSEFVRSALECVTGSWKSEAVFRCAKTDLLGAKGAGLSRDEIDKLENYALAAGIDGWRWNDDRVWRPLFTGDIEQEIEEDREAGDSRMAELLRVRDALVGPLRALEKRLKSAKTVRALCEGLYSFLEETGAADSLERWSREDAEAGQPGRAAAHRPIWDGVMNLLDQLVELTGDLKPDLKLFAGMVDSGLEELKLGAVPPSLDGVLIGSPERTRSDRVSVVYLLGVNDGVMPKRMAENGLLSEEERDALALSGLEMAPGARRRLLDERFLAYLALTAASRHLWIGYPIADNDGKSLLPSEWIGRIQRKFPGMPIRMEAAEPQDGDGEDAQLSFAVHPGRAMTHLLARLRRWRQGDSIAPGWWSVYEWLRERGEWKDRIGQLLRSLHFTNVEPPLAPETSRLLYGDRLLASVSRMERFVSCPFRHFASNGLRLRERQLYRVDAPDIGQLFHAALRQTTERLFADANASPTMEQLRLEAAASVERLLPKVQQQILLSSSRHAVMARKLRAIVAQAAGILGGHAELAAFRPVGLELDFGPTGALPPLSLELGGGRWMDVAGRIDRVDAAQSPEGLLLRVMDYKSSGMKLKLDEVSYGLSLQMLTYLDVVVTHAPHWLGQTAAPAGVLYFHVHNPLLHTANGMSQEEANDRLFREFRMQGLLLADGEAVKLMDDSLDGGGAKSAVVPVEFKKDGSFSARSQVAEPAQWDILRKSVRRQIRGIGKRIVEGDVSIKPYRMERKSPCTFCEYKAVCQFDLELEGNEFKTLAKAANRDELWRRLEDQAGEGGMPV
ncbi:helicase-exonuclease AddAB subunit AddB [Cohnella faecalis]|uniref:Helicase-exonuclease AddAB subunit AddB n=1 Tax=Cohnella faecalis TaxID=2315694 RepID=A0A398CNK9_9BACL|nr:helicase-exonuclease AddAB subunit AddB [Cohnella faecalis]RIE04193.1 helicase-exonuclease AddAB subunit AddB [Cohnella faecalis]